MVLTVTIASLIVVAIALVNAYLVYTAPSVEKLQSPYHPITGTENPMLIDLGGNCWVWHQDGMRHRTDGPAIIHSSGWMRWYEHGETHRLGYPAVIWQNGDREWWYKGMRHRTDGPAVMYHNGTVEYWINHKEVSEYEIMFTSNNHDYIINY